MNEATPVVDMGIVKQFREPTPDDAKRHAAIGAAFVTGLKSAVNTYEKVGKRVPVKPARKPTPRQYMITRGVEMLHAYGYTDATEVNIINDPVHGAIFVASLLRSMGNGRDKQIKALIKEIETNREQIENGQKTPDQKISTEAAAALGYNVVGYRIDTDGA